MTGKYAIGIDFGSLSGRAVLVSTSDGSTVAEKVMNYPHAVIDRYLPGSDKKLPPDFALQHPQDYLDVLDCVIPSVLKESGVEPDSVCGIGLDFTCCTMLPVTFDGTPLCFLKKYETEPHAYVKLWKHHAAQRYADRLNTVARERGESWLDSYGGKISSEWMFPKIWETLDCAPEVYFDAAEFCEAGDWLNLVLTGKRSKSYVFAAAKSIYDHSSGYPSREFFRALDPRLENVVSEKLSSPIVYSGKPVGTVCEYAARRFGLSRNTVVSCALPDAHVATVALNMRTAGDMCAIMGTSTCFMLLGDREQKVPGVCGIIKDGLTPGFWGYEAGLCCVGDLFAWAAENVAPASYKQEAGERGIPLLALLIEKAARKRPGETGLLALDWWNGNRSVLVDTDLSGLLVGMTLGTKPEDIMRALIEATAFGTRIIKDTYAENGVEVRRIIAAGGIAFKDPFTMQLYADVLQREIVIAGATQIPALASAIYATAASGVPLSEAMNNMSRLSDTVYRPDPAASAVYDRLYNEYRSLYTYFGKDGSDVMKRLRKIKAEALSD